jgi:hypothetical protein
MTAFQIWTTPDASVIIDADAIDVQGGVLFLRTGDDLVASFAAGSWTYANAVTPTQAADAGLMDA